MFNIISSDISHSSFNDDTKIQRVRSLLLYSWAFYIYKMYNIYFVSLHTTPSRLLEHLCSSFAYITKWFCLLLLLLLRLYNHLILLSWWDEYKIILWSHPWGKQPRKKNLSVAIVERKNTMDERARNKIKERRLWHHKKMSVCNKFWNVKP